MVRNGREENRSPSQSPLIISETTPLIRPSSARELTRDLLVSRDEIHETLPTVNNDHLLYVSHFLSTWNSRMFEFGAMLFLVAIFPNSLREMSVYSLVRACSAIVLAPVLGNFIDSGNRLRVLTISIVGQRVAVAASCVGFWALKVDLLQGYDSTEARSLLLLALILLACVEKLCSIMNTVSMERDWVVVVAETDTLRLQRLNVRMRQIDLTCKLIGPLVISIFDGVSTILAICIVGGLTIVSLPVEYLAIAKVYNMIPALHENKIPPSGPTSPDNQAMIWATYTRSLYMTLMGYVQHPVFMPSLAISILYLTVLSFAGQMVAYLLSIGYTSTQIGILRTVSVAFEISATWVAPIAMRKVGPTRAGLWFISWQLIYVAVAAGCFWGTYLSPTNFAAWGFIAGVILSRTGLWGFDLCVQVIVQEEVESTSRGSFSSVEASLQNFFELCSYVLTIIYAHPSQFGYPVLCTVASVYVAGGLYALFVRRRRGHLFHVSCFEKQRTVEQGGARNVIRE